MFDDCIVTMLNSEVNGVTNKKMILFLDVTVYSSTKLRIWETFYEESIVDRIYREVKNELRETLNRNR